MKHILPVLLAVLTIAVIGNLQHSLAQNPAITPELVSYSGLHTSCPTVTDTTKAPAECHAGDGFWISDPNINGGTYYKVLPQLASAPGVTSLNGKTGDLKVSAVATAPVATTTATAPSVAVSVQ